LDSSDVAFPSPSPSPGRRTEGPDLRASDTERDAAASELSAHYQAGRLDQNEFDERLTRAFQARTRGDLIELLADLPLQPVAPAEPEQDPEHEQAAVPAGFWLLPLVVPLMLVAVAAAGAASRGGDHGGAGALFLLWWLIPVIIFRSRRPRGR
jgi:Domain of unknown function (DUF1707)